MVQINKATVSDHEVVTELIMNLFVEIKHHAPIEDSQYFRELCREILCSDNYVVFLAQDQAQNDPCGVITLNEALSIYAEGKFGVIREFYIKKKKRSLGIGNALLNHAKHYAVAKNWRRLEVTAPSKKEWTKTYKFYHQNRFVEVGRRLIFHTGG